ncbi:MAG: GldG family protein, partial [Pseudomonadota bacterium]|nr:GldG family protein [Pseudomonadota bacterium]
MNRGLLSASALTLALILLLALNILSGLSLRGARIDLTEDRLYTLTDGTLQVLDELQDEVTLNFYFSAEALRDVPNIKSYAMRVEELLNEYVNHADGRLRLNVVDPEPFSDAEDRAVQFGIRGIPLNDVGDVAYFGLAGVNTTDGEEVIPFFHPSTEDTLEYEITRLIYNLDRPGKKVVGIISPLPLDGRVPNMPPNAQAGPVWTVLEQVREVFDTRLLRDEQIDRIADDIDLLMLAHPRELSERTLYAIDQFVLGGGR